VKYSVAWPTRIFFCRERKFAFPAQGRRSLGFDESNPYLGIFLFFVWARGYFWTLNGCYLAEPCFATGPALSGLPSMGSFSCCHLMSPPARLKTRLNPIFFIPCMVLALRGPMRQ